MENNQTKRRGLGALDVFIILALIAVAAGVFLHSYGINRTDVGSTAVLENYRVTFQVLDIRDSSNARHMHTGDKYYLKDTGAFFGTLQDTNQSAPASYFKELGDGTVVKVQNAGTGDYNRIDVVKEVVAQGLTDQNGAFLLGGNTYLGVNKELQIYSKYLAITVKITGITKEVQ